MPLGDWWWMRPAALEKEGCTGPQSIVTSLHPLCQIKPQRRIGHQCETFRPPPPRCPFASESQHDENIDQYYKQWTPLPKKYVSIFISPYPPEWRVAVEAKSPGCSTKTVCPQSLPGSVAYGRAPVDQRRSKSQEDISGATKKQKLRMNRFKVNWRSMAASMHLGFF